MRILIVDDSPTIRDITASTLRSANYDVIEAEHGVAGLDVLRREPVDLIISDLHMYTMGGVEFVSKVRENPKHAATPILFLTTEEADDLKEVGREVGATGWMVKPFDPAELLKLVRDLADW